MGFVSVAGGNKSMTVPVAGTPLSNLAEGSIIKINESGSPVEFYVAKHDYEPNWNVSGSRTLVVRKDCYDQRAWNTESTNTYGNSSIDTWLNSEYKDFFDTSVQNIIGQTKFVYTPMFVGDKTTNVQERSIFILSVTELGGSARFANTEGSAMPIASTLQIAQINNSAVRQWTRTPYKNNTASVFYINENTGKAEATSCTNAWYSRPCFTLPAYTLIDASGQVVI